MIQLELSLSRIAPHPSEAYNVLTTQTAGSSAMNNTSQELLSMWSLFCAFVTHPSCVGFRFRTNSTCSDRSSDDAYSNGRICVSKAMLMMLMRFRWLFLRSRNSDSARRGLSVRIRTTLGHIEARIRATLHEFRRLHTKQTKDNKSATPEL